MRIFFVIEWYKHLKIRPNLKYIIITNYTINSALFTSFVAVQHVFRFFVDDLTPQINPYEVKKYHR